MFFDQLLIFIIGFLLGGLLTIIFIWIIFFRKKSELKNSETDLAFLSNQMNKIDNEFKNLLKKEGSNETLLGQVVTSNQNILTNVKTLEKTLTRGASVIQGNWAQTICENILKEIGFKKGREYESQKKYLDIYGKEKVPDFVIHLPEDRNYIIDSKVSISDWYDYTNATNEIEKTQAKKRHLISVMKHIKELSEAGYTNLRDLNNDKALNTGEFILMFMPIENAYQSLAEESDKIRTEAIKNNITIVGPSTLHLALRIVEQMWSMDKQAKNTKEAINIAYKMHTKAININKSFQAVTKSFSNAQESIKTASNQIESGNGNFISLVNKFKTQLGLVTKDNLFDKSHNKEKKNHEEIET